MAEICVFLAEGFEECEALLVVDILRRGGVKTTTFSVTENQYVTSSHNVTVKADKTVLEFDPTQFDGLFLPGGMPGTVNLSQSSLVIDTAKQYYDQNKIIAAICAAPSILGQLGFLNGKEATSFPAFEDKLEGAIVQQTEFVQAENILTGRGLGAAIPFGLQLLKMIEGEETSQKIRNAICYMH